MSNAAKSPRAYALYRELVTEANRTPVEPCKNTDLTDAELWWSELSPLESWVFGLDPALLHALTYVYVRYQDMIGITDTEFLDFRDEDRAAFPHCCHGDAVASQDDAVNFMMEACDLPYVQSLMWVCRACVQNARSGIYFGPEGAPAWAYAEVNPDRLFVGPDSWDMDIARGDAAR